MSRSAKLAAIVATSAAAVALTAAPAAAWTTAPFTATSSNLVVKVGTSTVATCSSTLGGNMNASGAFTVTSATATGCGVGVTPTGLPWTGSATGGVATITAFKMTALGCTYTGNLTGTEAEPVVTFTNQPVTGSGSFLCFNNVSVSATYTFAQ